MNVANYFDGSFELEKDGLGKKDFLDGANNGLYFGFSEFDVLELFVGGEAMNNFVNIDFDRLFIHLCLLLYYYAQIKLQSYFSLISPIYIIINLKLI